MLRKFCKVVKHGMVWLTDISYLYLCINSNTSSPVPCTQSIPQGSTVKRSASLSIPDFEEISSVNLSPARSKGSSFIGIGSKKRSLTTSLSAGSDIPFAPNKMPYMLVKW